MKTKEVSKQSLERSGKFWKSSNQDVMNVPWNITEFIINVTRVYENYCV